MSGDIPVIAPLQSAIFEGRVQHRRRDATKHAFGYRLFLVYLDLAEIDALVASSGPLPQKWWKPLRYSRRDYLGNKDVPLDRAVRDEVQRLCSVRPNGAIRMLTSLRTFGYVFNPVTFYYCFRDDGGLFGVLAEITNTPWGERHCYFTEARGDGAQAVMAKRFHVSPFQPMEQTYEWRFSTPQATLAVEMHNRERGEIVFDAELHMQRVELTAATLRRTWLRYPWTTLKVILAIHVNALKLWWKGARFHSHPRKRKATA